MDFPPKFQHAAFLTSRLSCSKISAHLKERVWRKFHQLVDVENSSILSNISEFLPEEIKNSRYTHFFNFIIIIF